MFSCAEGGGSGGAAAGGLPGGNGLAMGRDAALLGVGGLVAKPPGFRERCEASAVRATSAGSPPVGLLSAGSDAGALPSPPKLGNGEAVGRGDADGLALVPVLFGESLPRAGDFDRLKSPICRLSSLVSSEFRVRSLPTNVSIRRPKSCQSYRASCPTVLLIGATPLAPSLATQASREREVAGEGKHWPARRRRPRQQQRGESRPRARKQQKIPQHESRRAQGFGSTPGVCCW